MKKLFFIICFLLFGHEAFSAPTLDAVSSTPYINTNTGATTVFDFNMQQGNLTNGLVIVIVNTASDPSPVSVTYGGATMTQIGQSSHTAYSAIYGLKLGTSSSGTKVVEITVSATSINIYASASTWNGVDQTTGWHNYNSGGNTTGGTGSVVITSVSGEVVVDGISTRSTNSMTPDASQTTLWNNTTGLMTGSSYKAGAASVTMQWTWTDSGDAWAIGGVSLIASSGGGGGGGGSCTGTCTIIFGGDDGLD